MDSQYADRYNFFSSSAIFRFRPEFFTKYLETAFFLLYLLAFSALSAINIALLLPRSLTATPFFFIKLALELFFYRNIGRE
jgi:hypothetical protein